MFGVDPSSKVRILYPMKLSYAHLLAGILCLVLMVGCDLRTFNQPPDKNPETSERESSNTNGLFGVGEEVTTGAGGANSPGHNLTDIEEAFAVATYGSTGEAIYSYTNDGYLDLRAGTTEKANDGALWAFHQPLEEIENRGGKKLEFMRQFASDGKSVHLWAKTPTTGAKVRVVGYYTTDNSDPLGRGGVGAGTTKVIEFFWGHNSPSERTGTDDWWWSEPIRLPSEIKSLRYKIGVFRVAH